MDLRQLESFVTVANLGGMSRAAVHLQMAQPSVSRQIALLEKELGQRLLRQYPCSRRATPAVPQASREQEARVRRVTDLGV